MKYLMQLPQVVFSLCWLEWILKGFVENISLQLFTLLMFSIEILLLFSVINDNFYYL